MKWFICIGLVMGGRAWPAEPRDQTWSACEKILGRQDPPADLFSLPLLTSSIGSRYTGALVEQLRRSPRTPVEVDRSERQRHFVTFLGRRGGWEADVRVDFAWRAETNDLKLLRLKNVRLAPDLEFVRMSDHRSIAEREGTYLFTRSAVYHAQLDEVETSEVLSSIERAIAPDIPHAFDPTFRRRLGRAAGGRYVEVILHDDPSRNATVIYDVRDARLHSDRDFVIDPAGWNQTFKGIWPPKKGSLAGFKILLPAGLLDKLATKHLLWGSDLARACEKAPPHVKHHGSRTYVTRLRDGAFVRVAFTMSLKQKTVHIVTAYVVRSAKFYEYLNALPEGSRARAARLVGVDASARPGTND